MSKFRSAYSGQVRHTSLTGNGHEPEYEYKVTDEGREHMVCDFIEDTCEYR